MKEISDELYAKLELLGVIGDDVRNHNIGKSDYSSGEHLIQPWTIWLDYPNLTSFDHDILKRILRTKEGDSRKMDYEKIIHICQERIRQIDVMEKQKDNDCVLPKKGDDFLCVKDFLIDVGYYVGTLFTENFYYTSPKDGYITDNLGTATLFDANGMKEYFKKVKKQ